ncbi:hypothetical protein HZA97_09745 [Candidatus Woesearchaeota archaeon]|nr:hypothetical protein [Candidatus Woesearchaeota archaeon]
MTQKFEEDIYFKDEGKTMVASITYERIQTKQEEELLRDYYQQRFFERTGRKVMPKRKEIEVKPKAGESISETIYFQVRENQPLYAGIYFLPQKAPYVIPKLIDCLNKFKQEVTSHKENKDWPIVDYTIKELEKIVREQDDA